MFVVISFVECFDSWWFGSSQSFPKYAVPRVPDPPPVHKVEIGRETDSGHWPHPVEPQIPFSIWNRTFSFGQILKAKRWSIQELLPNGKMGHEIDIGSWTESYPTVFSFSINGRHFLYGQNKETKNWMIRELLPDGKMGDETANGSWDKYYPVAFHFSINGQHFIYGQYDDANDWVSGKNFFHSIFLHFYVSLTTLYL